MADIVVTDDALGTETLTLTGADAALFEIDIFSADDPDVTVFGSSVDGSLTQADLDREADDIADDLEGIGVFGSVGLSYHF